MLVNNPLEASQSSEVPRADPGVMKRQQASHAGFMDTLRLRSPLPTSKIKLCFQQRRQKPQRASSQW